MRRLLSFLLAVLAGLLVPAALSAQWMAHVSSDTATYVDVVGPLADNKGVREAMAEQAGIATVEAVREQSSLLADLGGTAIQTSATTAARTVVQSKRFPAIWREMNRDMHRQFLRAMDEDGNRITLDLRPLISATVKLLAGPSAAALLRIDTPVPASFEVHDPDALRNLRVGYHVTQFAGWAVPLLAGAVLVGAIVLRPLSIRRAARWWAVAMTLGSVAALAVVRLGHQAASSRPNEESARTLATALWDGATTPLDHRLWIAAALGVVVALGSSLLSRKP